MGEAVDRLVALAGRVHVGAYKRKSKTGKIVSVGAYTRSPSSMSVQELAKEVTQITAMQAGKVKPAAPPQQLANRKAALVREQRKRGASTIGARKVPAKKGPPQLRPRKVPEGLTASEKREGPVRQDLNQKAKKKSVPFDPKKPELTASERKEGPVKKAAAKTDLQGPPKAKKAAAAKKTAGKRPTPEMDKIPHGLRGKGTASGTVDDPINCAGNVVLAAKLVQEGKHVRLNKVDEVGILVDRLGQIALEAKAKGDKAPLYNLCLISVPKTNLFCAENKGIPRIKMPQLGGEPVPGTRADKLKRSPWAADEVDVTKEFIEDLGNRGISMVEKTVPAASLKASQNELVGSKVAGIMAGMQKALETHNPDSFYFAPIFVTRDNYVIDGHHRWAGQVGMDAQDGKLGDVQMKVRMIDMDIGEALDYVNAFAKDIGIAQKGSDDAKTPEGPGATPKTDPSKTTASAMDRLKAEQAKRAKKAKRVA